MQPQPFGLYTLIHRINVGGMAEVFKACYYANGVPSFAAIKRILPHLAQDRSFIDMFITEAHTAGRLVHPNIAQIIEQGEEEGEYYISMEYVSGRDLLYLRHHLRERGMFFPPALAAYVMMGVADALDYAHRLCDSEGLHLEIIHRDVSPQNILISYSGEVKLIDFGIAKAKIRTQEHTRAGVLKGKFGYMAPEQVKGQEMDHRADIFALGTVFYELLTNQRLFMGNSDIETLEMVREARVVPPSSINEWIPPQLDQIILYALQPDPQHRFQSAGDLAQALNYFLQQEAPMTHGNTLKTWMAQEFSTFIAHEKAQDAFLLDQMNQNLADDQEDLDSTSLISADAIALLNQYTAQELGSDTASQLTPEHKLSEDPTGPIHADPLWETAQHESDTVPPQSAAPSTVHRQNLHHDLNDQPATRQVEASMYQGLNALASSQPHTPFLSPNEVRRDESVDEQYLEDLLDESLDDEADESEVSAVQDNLDQILAQSITYGQSSPLSPFSTHTSTAPQPLPQVLVSSVDQNHSPQFIDTPQAPIPPIKLPSPLSHSTTPPLGHFSANEPTPIPNMRTPLPSPSSRSRARGEGGVSVQLKALIAILGIALIGGGVWFILSAPAPTPISLELTPNQGVTVQLGSSPPQEGLPEQILQFDGPQRLVIRHPDFPSWNRELDPQSIPQQRLKINLEESVPHHQLNVRSNTERAEVWIFGKLRGTTPFSGNVPLSRLGHVVVEVKSSGQAPQSKTLTPKGNKPLFYYARF